MATDSETTTNLPDSTEFPKAFAHQEIEPQILQAWDAAQIGKPDLDPNNTKEPFSILMPPPNANASLHAGHAMFVIQDILIRYKRMQGHPTVWFPGTDHAGFETQFVYEKHLKKAGKSRFQFDRETLYNDIAAFVDENSGVIIHQLKRLGFSADWDRLTFTLDEHVVDTVIDTFAKLEKEGLIYRDDYIVNYCPKLGTSFSDLEVVYKDQVTPLYSIRYRFADGEPRIINGVEMTGVVVATVRPETIFADVAVAIHPEDPRAAALVGELVLNPLTRAAIPIIADTDVDPEFGSGMLKITPAHDQIDFAIGKRHNLPIISTINTLGKISLDWHNPQNEPEKTRAEQLYAQFHNLAVNNARSAVVKLLEVENAIESVNDKYENRVSVSYKGEYPIEPLPLPNWFVKMQSLADLGLQAVREGEVKIIPQRFEKQYFQWLENIRDWPISRQVVWGIRMPVWYDISTYSDIFVSFLATDGERKHLTVAQALEAGHTHEEIRAGLQQLTAPSSAQYVVSKTSPGENYLQETDTFDTWFSSGQWPLVTTGYPDGEDFKRFYPTSVMDTMWDILFFWVARMIMLGKYLTKTDEQPNGISPFKTVYLHSMVTDAKGAKMSKSKGNVVNPLDIIEKFGADALRIALVAGSAPGNPIALSEDKVKGYRNFANKIWNIGRFIWMQEQELGTASPLDRTALQASDQAILEKLDALVSATTDNLDRFRFSDAALGLYDFLWNEFAQGYLEENKQREDKTVYLAIIKEIYLTSIKLLHPFMPFVTEAVWKELKQPGLLAKSRWE